MENEKRLLINVVLKVIKTLARKANIQKEALTLSCILYSRKAAIEQGKIDKRLEKRYKIKEKEKKNNCKRKAEKTSRTL